MTPSFTCKYCGAQQHWSGSGTPVCAKCGASQAESSPPAATAPVPAAHIRPLIWVVLLLLTGIGIVLLLGKERRKVSAGAAIPPAVPSRVLVVQRPVLHLMDKNSSFTPEDFLNATPKVNFPPEQLAIVSKEYIPDQDNKRVFVGEVKNTSETLTVAAPVGRLQLLRHGAVVFTGDLTSEDLAPGQSGPFMIQPRDVENTVFDDVRVLWIAPMGFGAGTAGAAQLQAAITSQKVTPTTETVNFAQTFHYNTVQITGVVHNVGRGLAHHVKVYAVLRDPKGGLSGYTEQDVSGTLAAGEAVTFELSVDEWGGKIARVDLIPVQITPP